MIPLAFLGNGASPHVRTWSEMFDAWADIDVYDVARSEADVVARPIHRPLSAWQEKLPKPLRYGMLGQLAKAVVPDGVLLHAHSASGFGFAALASGRPYIVTTYGSEIFQNGSALQKQMTRAVLANAKLITATSKLMEDTIVRDYGIDRTKIFTTAMFDRDYAEAPYPNKPPLPPTWLVARRMLPLYNTDAVIEAFGRYRTAGGEGRLVLFEGRKDDNYAARMAELANAIDGIEIVEGFIDPADVRKHYGDAHFTISVPNSDQMSTTILEGAALGALPVVAPLDAYEAVAPITIKLRDDVSLVEALTQMFNETAGMTASRHDNQARQARDFVVSRFSPAVVSHNLLSRIEQVLRDNDLKMSI